MSSFWKDIGNELLHGPPPEELTPAQSTYERLSTFPIFIASVAWVVGMVFQFDPYLSPTYGAEGRRIGVIVWVLFAADFAIRFFLDPNKKTFLKRYGFLLFALILPPLRIMLVIAAVRRITGDRNSLAKKVGMYAGYAVSLVVIFGALLTLMFEVRSPDSNIDSFGDAVWWGFVTVTTVGYGDFTPVTVPGRVIGVTIMFAGAGAVGVVTAAVASRFVAGSKSGSSAGDSSASSDAVDAHPSPAITALVQQEDATLTELRQQLAQMEQQLAAISTHLGVAPDSPVPSATSATTVTPAPVSQRGDAQGQGK